MELAEYIAAFNVQRRQEDHVIEIINFLKENPEIDVIASSIKREWQLQNMSVLEIDPRTNRRFFEIEVPHDADAYSNFKSNVDTEIRVYGPRFFPTSMFTTQQPLPLICLSFEAVHIRLYIPDDLPPTTNITLEYDKHYYQYDHRVKLSRNTVTSHGLKYNQGKLLDA